MNRGFEGGGTAPGLLQGAEHPRLLNSQRPELSVKDRQPRWFFSLIKQVLLYVHNVAFQ